MRRKSGERDEALFPRGHYQSVYIHIAFVRLRQLTEEELSMRQRAEKRVDSGGGSLKRRRGGGGGCLRRVGRGRRMWERRLRVN